MYSNGSSSVDSWIGSSAIAIFSVLTLLCACAKGMYTHDFVSHLIFAVMMVTVGIPIILYCLYNLKWARKEKSTRKQTELQETDTLMHIENHTVINQGGRTITIQQIHSNALSKLKDENEMLTGMLKGLEEAFHARVYHHNLDNRNHAAERAQWRQRLDDCHDRLRNYHRLYHQEKDRLAKEEVQNKRNDSTARAEHAELPRLRKAERERKYKDRWLLNRVLKARKQIPTRQLAASRKSLATAMKYANEDAVDKGGDGVSNQLICNSQDFI